MTPEQCYWEVPELATVARNNREDTLENLVNYKEPLK